MFLSVSGKLRIGTAADMLLDEKDIREAQQ
jgi:hypothetical protein